MDKFWKGFVYIKDLWMVRPRTKALDKLWKFECFFLREGLYDFLVNINEDPAKIIMSWFFFTKIDEKYMHSLLAIPRISKHFDEEARDHALQVKSETVTVFLHTRQLFLDHLAGHSQEILQNAEDVACMEEWIKEIL